MAYYSKLYGRQVNKSVELSAHKGAGALLTFPSFADFPSPAVLCESKHLVSYLNESDPHPIPEYFNYADTSTLNIYVDAESNMMYRWKHFTIDEWKQSYWEQDEMGNFIAPVMPNQEDYSDEEEYQTALEEYNASLYPLNPDVPDASMGWTYVPCAGGGGGGSDLYWSKF